MKKISKFLCLLLAACMCLTVVTGCSIFKAETKLADGRVGVE